MHSVKNPGAFHFSLADTHAALHFSLFIPTNLSSPAATVASLRKWSTEIYTLMNGRIRRDTYERIARAEDYLLDCLDLSTLPEYTRDYAGRGAALGIKGILDRLDLSGVVIPGADPAESDLPASWTIPDTELVIVRIERDGRDPVYRFSSDTVENALDYYDRIDHLPLIDDSTPRILERYLYEPKQPMLARIVRAAPGVFLLPVWRYALWQWLGLLGGISLAFLLIVIFIKIDRRHRFKDRLVGKLNPPRGLLGPICVMVSALMLRGFISDDLGFRGGVAEFTGFITGLLFLLCLATVITIVGGRIGTFVASTSSRMGRELDDQLVRLITRAVSLGVAILVFVEGGKSMGIPLNTLLAGAGIGGIAVALAAQDAVKNLIGGVILSLDKPFSVGELVKVGGFTGVVTAIGMRSTRLRDFGGHHISIPNDTIATSTVENISKRTSIRRLTDLALPLDITRAKAEQAAELVRGILKDHDGMDPESPPGVFLCNLERDHLVLRFLCYYTPPDFMKYLKFCEHTNLAIMEAFEKHDIRLAVPMSETALTGREESPVRVESKVVGEP